MVRFLLSCGADVNAAPSDGSTVFPLYAAARHSHPQILDILLEHGADVSVRNGQVFEAAVQGGQQILTRLLQLDLTPSEREVYLDKTLQKSASYFNLMLCTWLLDQGANVNFAGGEFGSPLQAALSCLTMGDATTQNNRSLIITMFLKRGANVNVSDPKRDWPNPLMAAMNSYNQKAILMLLDAGADVNCYGGKLHSPVQCAARHSTAALRLILDKGVDVNVIRGKYGTALHAAAYAHNVDRLKILLERGADVSIIAGKYSSCIQAAAKKLSRGSDGFLAERQSVEAMELLLEHGASVTVVGGPTVATAL
jgi:ankyrin repeat protein